VRTNALNLISNTQSPLHQLHLDNPHRLLPQLLQRDKFHGHQLQEQMQVHAQY